MKLQLALDETSLTRALELAGEVADYVDLIEIGTPLIMAQGMAAVRAMRQRFPAKPVLADLKIIDGGYDEAALAFEAGARYVTACALADQTTLRQSLRAAQDHSGVVVADLLSVPDLPRAVASLESLGLTALAVHTGVDQQASGHGPLEDLHLVKAGVRSASVAVAGGISAASIGPYLEADPDVVIVGAAITRSADPATEAKAIRAALDAVAAFAAGSAGGTANGQADHSTQRTSPAAGQPNVRLRPGTSQ
ncbi:MAG: orotidine 5'-phosphate decarboxylase [Bifidobacteriaceae bacterium]|jgi:3-hexulose-6-phosphate synthase|nr:orotidine 5'-phosphate decarboxylase [Bifidobacteriaceae bacterium]